ncbi:hypothetical protein [Burkholderia sp. 3C]
MDIESEYGVGLAACDAEAAGRRAERALRMVSLLFCNKSHTPLITKRFCSWVDHDVLHLTYLTGRYGRLYHRKYDAGMKAVFR